MGQPLHSCWWSWSPGLNLGSAYDEPDDSSSGDGDDESEAQIAVHALPISCVLAVVQAWAVKHVIDLCPTPLPFGAELIEQGVTYFALCHSQFQLDWHMAALRASRKSKILTPGTKLFDKRSAVTPAAAPGAADPAHPEEVSVQEGGEEEEEEEKE